MSLPSRERGLKSVKYDTMVATVKVAPFAGAWIEITVVGVNTVGVGVTPFTGTCSEIH